jgi:hypothetical protein
MIRPPLDGRLPVIAQIRDIGVPQLEIEREESREQESCSKYFLDKF